MQLSVTGVLLFLLSQAKASMSDLFRYLEAEERSRVNPEW